MDKQKLLEYIAPYLPYNVKAQLYFNGKKQHQVVNSNKTLDLRTVAFYIENYDHIGFKIILHPLSDLNKPCLEGGKIPIVELANMLKPNLGWHMTGDGGHCISSGCDYFFYYDGCWFNLTDSDGNKQSFNQLDCLKFIYKHHFDIHNLIGRGYAIDINTLNSSKVEFLTNE